ncbi:tape measure protein [Parabacteroides sp. PF5-9]|uniref:tape measure protein n=1 Tax=Parabacteroides sp. PF5-9 TaxID=1742404 RepID=UPI0024766CF0|nr:tape measure protein [Parabacteroides sp. PF5-9]MDH6356956.1 tape measure domain-containing protein [Parabacteroides sp. PF5-9]
MQKAFLKLGGTAAFAGLVQQVITVRGEFQQLGIAFETMLGSKEKADTMMAEIKELALSTPFTITEVADNTKQLIAMGIATENVMDTMKALGDVAAGVSVPMSRIAVNYGQVSALGRLQSREIRDFAMAGIPIVEELAKMLGKTSAEIYEMTEAGQVGFPLVEQAFKNMSSEGGKFHDMMRKTNTSLTGQLSKLQDEFKLMFDAIGEANEGIIYSAIGTASDLVANYEKIGKMLVSLVATYGVYRAALAIVIATEKGYTIAQLANYKALLMVEKAQKLLNATMLKNPYVLAATLIMGVVAAMWALHDSTTAAEKAQKQFADKNQAIVDASEQRKESAKELIGIIQDESQAETDRLKAYNELIKIYPTLFKDIDIEKIKVAELTGLVKSLNEEESKRYGKEKQSQLSNLYKQRDSLNKTIESLSYSPNGNRIIRKKEAEQDLKNVESQIKALEDEKKAFLELQKQSGKKEPDSMYGADYETARKAWEKEKDLLESIQKDRNKYTTKEYESAVENEKTKREAFEKLGGVTKVDTSAQKESERLAKEKLDIEKRLNEELLRLQQDNIRDNIDLMEEGYEKRLALINNEYDREIEAIRQKEKEWRDAQGGNLTDDQQTEIKTKTSNISKKQLQETERLNKEMLDKERQSWIDYNKEYGNYQEKRLAITEDYANRIAKAETEGEKSILRKEEEKALQELEASMIEKSDLWVRLFDDVRKQSNDSLKEIISQTQHLIDYLKGVEGVEVPVGFEGMDLESLKGDLPAIEKLMQGLITKRDELNKRDPFGSLIGGFKQLGKAIEDAKANGGKITDAFKSEEGMEALGQIQGGISDVGGMLGDIGNSMKEVFGEGAAETIDNITKSIDGLTKVGSGAAKLIGGDLTGIVDLLQGIPSLISGIGGLFNGNNDDKLDKQIDRYEKIVDLYDQLIDKQKEYLSTLTGSDASKQAEEIEEMIKNQLKAAENSLAAWGDKGKSWNHHSFAHRVVRDLGKDLGITSFEDLFDWDAAKWEELQKNIELWEKLPDEVAAYGQAVIEAKDSTDDLGEALKEAVTGVSFDTLKDSLDDIVTQADMTFDDIANSFEDHMSKAVLKMVKSQYLTNELKKWYDQFTDAAKSDDEITAAEADALRKYYTQIAEKGNDLYKQAMELANIDITDKDGSSSDNTLKGAYTKADQQSIDLLAGQTGAARVVLEDIRRMMDVSGSDGQVQHLSGMENTMAAIRDMQMKGWEDVRIIKELSQRLEQSSSMIANNTEILNQISERIAGSTERTADRLNNPIEVKMKGGGLGL